jgi:CubicO group peptidase (beta-lactamase class C family)
MRILATFLFLSFALTTFAATGAANTSTPPQRYATPRFEDADRSKKIAAVLPEIDQVYIEFARERHVPGLVYGILLDGQLVHTGATGLASLERKIPSSPDIRFRIASMTKSFTALAILQLRDAGKLALHDPVEKFIPEFRQVKPLTADAPAITLRHLLTMTPGFPEDNPWGDQQLAVSVEDLRAFVSGGVALSNAPGVAFEYSNFAYALLGQVISTVAQEPYQRYIHREILEPLGMRDTRWEFADVPTDKLALGYRWENNAWRPEPLLHDGTYGAMGGLLTTMRDFARYVSFHLAAWPPRDAPDGGIVRRATLREMHKPAVISSIVSDAKTLSGEPAPFVVGYGYGLRWSMDDKNTINVGHSGGLPGFGSNYRFYPDHGFAVISFANLTYASMGMINLKVGAILLEKARLPRRMLPPSTLLDVRKEQVAALVQTWDATLAEALVADNFFLDRSREDWSRLSRETLSRAGKIVRVGAIVPENQLRGTFPLLGEQGRIDVFFTLTPEKAARLQELRLTFVKNP